jgi:hypothetical protein
MASEADSIPMLDLCIDAVISGDEWREVAPKADHEWLAPLIEVVETLLEDADTLPGMPEGEHANLWQRVVRQLRPGAETPRRFLSRLTCGGTTAVLPPSAGEFALPGPNPRRRWCWDRT